MSPGVLTQDLMLIYGKVFYPLSHVPAPRVSDKELHRWAPEIAKRFAQGT